MTPLEVYVLSTYATGATPDYTVVCRITGKDAIDAEREVMRICRKFSTRKRRALAEDAAAA